MEVDLASSPTSDYLFYHEKHQKQPAEQALVFRATQDPLLGEVGISYGSGGSWTRLDGGRLKASEGKILIEKTAEGDDLSALRKALDASI